MKVRFRQTGGIAGLVLGCDLDTTIMLQDEANQLLQLVEQARVHEIGERRHPRGRDLLAYELVIEEKGRGIKTSFDSMTALPQVEPLLQFLSHRAHAVPVD